MKKEIQIKVPTDWSSITYNQYMKLQADIEAYQEEEEALTATLFYHLCGVNPYTLQNLDLDTYRNIKRDLWELMRRREQPLKRIIQIDGKEWGFEPDLSKMSYGAYLDIQEYKDLDINKDWLSIMSILYRPVVQKKGVLYDIEPYKGENRGELFREVTMDIHFGALFFFMNLLKDLSKDTLKSLMEKEGMEEMSTILEKSGVLTQTSTT